MGDVGEQSARAVLHAHRGRTSAARRRAQRVRAHRPGHSERPSIRLRTTPMRFVRRLLHIVIRGRRDAELRKEMQFHQARKQRALEGAGFSPEAARAASRRALGNVTYTREASHAVWVPPDMESLWRDIPYAFRSLRRSPSFTIAAVLALGLGIGSAAAVFSLLDRVVLRPVSYCQPGRLVVLSETNPGKNLEHEGLSPVHFLHYRNLTRVFG